CHQAFRFGVRIEKLDDIKVRRAVHGVATDADTGALADAAGGELPDRFIGQCPAARDDADVALFVDVTGCNADAAAAVRIFAFTGRDDAGAVWADKAGLEIALQGALYADHVADGDALSD